MRSPPAGKSRGARDFWERRAYRLLRANSPESVVDLWDDFDRGAANWTRPTPTNCTVRSENSTAGGWYQMNTSAIASAQGRLHIANLSGSQTPIFASGGSSGAWYLAWRFKIGTTPNTAQTRLALTMASVASGYVGVLGKSLTVANYAFTADVGSALDSGVAITTAVRTMEVVRPVGESLTYLYLDKALVASGNTYPSVAWHPEFLAENGTGADVQQVLFDWICAKAVGGTP